MRMTYRTLLWLFVFCLLSLLGGRILDPRPTESALFDLWVVAVVSLSLAIVLILVKMHQTKSGS